MTLPINHRAEFAAILAAQIVPTSAYLRKPIRPLAVALADWGSNAHGAERMALACRIWWHYLPGEGA